MRRIRTVVVILALQAAAIAARAGFDDTTVRIAARVLGFMDKPPAGVIATGIVYAPDDPRSAADARRLEQLLGNGLRVGNITLQGKMVKIEDVGRDDARLFLLAEGVGAATGKLTEAARVKHVPCITTDLAQVRSGACAIGVRAEPRVEIIVNQAAATSTDVRFSTAFRMLITEF